MPKIRCSTFNVQLRKASRAGTQRPKSFVQLRRKTARGESFEREPSGFADPGAQHNFVVEGGGRFVVNLVSQYYPAGSLLCFRAGDSSPMRGGNILDPPQINGVVHVILLVDITRQDWNGHFERRGVHRKQEVRSK
jgi:hypothetical protein